MDTGDLSDGNTWFDMVVIPNTSNSDAVYSYELPSTVSGTVFVRVVDSDRSKNDIGLDTLWIDDMYIRSE